MEKICASSPIGFKNFRGAGWLACGRGGQGDRCAIFKRHPVGFAQAPDDHPCQNVFAPVARHGGAPNRANASQKSVVVPAVGNPDLVGLFGVQHHDAPVEVAVAIGVVRHRAPDDAAILRAHPIIDGQAIGPKESLNCQFASLFSCCRCHEGNLP